MDYVSIGRSIYIILHTWKTKVLVGLIWIWIQSEKVQQTNVLSPWKYLQYFRLFSLTKCWRAMWTSFWLVFYLFDGLDYDVTVTRFNQRIYLYSFLLDVHLYLHYTNLSLSDTKLHTNWMVRYWFSNWF